MAEQYAVESELEKFLRGQKRHSCLFRRAVALTLVALDTSRHQVLRRRFAALCARQYMVKRQFFGVLMLAAILAAITVTNINSRPFHRRFATATMHIDVMTKAHYAWHLER